MKVEIFALCDAAVDYGGKLSLLGAFDGIFAREAPVQHPQCAIAIRLRVSRSEEGPHRLEFAIIDADGHRIVPPIGANFEVRLPPQRESMAINLVLNIHQLKFERFDDYAIDLSIDGRQEASLPLVVVQVPPHGPPHA